MRRVNKWGDATAAASYRADSAAAHGASQGIGRGRHPLPSAARKPARHDARDVETDVRRRRIEVGVPRLQQRLVAASRQQKFRTEYALPATPPRRKVVPMHLRDCVQKISPAYPFRPRIVARSCPQSGYGHCPAAPLPRNSGSFATSTRTPPNEFQTVDSPHTGRRPALLIGRNHVQGP